MLYAEQSLRIDCSGRDSPMLIEKLALEMGLGPPTSESIMSLSQHPLKPVLGQAAPLTLQQAKGEQNSLRGAL